MTTMLATPRHSTTQFTYVRESNTWVGEISSLGNRPFGRVYADACDVGLTLVSQKTGREVVFAMSHEEYDREGDLVYVELRPVNEREWGAGTIRLFND